MKFHKQDLLDAGCMDGPMLETLHAYAQRLVTEKHITDPNYLLKLIRKAYPECFAVLKMQDDASPLAYAIEAESPEEQKNLKKASTQMQNLLHSPVITSGVLMPDACPAGSDSHTIPVGGAISVQNAIIPAAHSSDICCSLYASFFTSDLSTTELMDNLQQVTRFGPGGRHEQEWVHHPVMDEPVWQNPFLSRLENKAAMHMADQGDGNHFAYVGEMMVSEALVASLIAAGKADLASQIQPYAKLKVLVTHHGSRGLGAAVYQRGLEAAIKHTKVHARNIPKEAAWISMDCQLGEDYWQALQYIARWTEANHQSIHQQFLESISSESVASLGNQHNFVWKRGDQYLHGKGATPAWQDEGGNPLLGLIPMNMAQPILLTIGRSNRKFLQFSPHGAGRNCSRTTVLKRYFHKKKGMDRARMQSDIAESTAQIDVRWYLGEPDITECAIAYKDPVKLRKQIEQFQLAEVIAEIQPLGCLMAGRAPRTTKELTPKQLRQIEHRANRRKIKQYNWLDEM